MNPFGAPCAIWPATGYFKGEARDCGFRLRSRRRISEKAEKRLADERAEVERKPVMKRLGDEFEATLGGIINAVSSNSIVLKRGAGSLAKTAENTQDKTSVVAASSEEALTNVQSVAASAAELTPSLRSIAEQVDHSRKMAGEAVLRRKDRRPHRGSNPSRVADRGVVQFSGEGG